MKLLADTSFARLIFSEFHFMAGRPISLNKCCICGHKILDGCRLADIHMNMDLQDPALQTILRLPTEDRIQAAQAILASLQDSEDATLSPEMIALLDERLEEYQQNPGAGESWESVRASIEAGS